MATESNSGNQQLLSDLEFATKLARDGANTPLLGGVYLLIWSSLLIPTLILHGAIIDGWVPLGKQYLGMMWGAYGLFGGLASTLYGFKSSGKVGENTWLNRLSRTSGISVAVLIFGFAIALGVAVSMGKFTTQHFNLILPFAFAVQSFHLTILGRLSQKKYLVISSYFAVISMVATLLLNDSNAIYYLSSLSVLLTMTLPGYLELRDEKAHG